MAKRKKPQLAKNASKEPFRFLDLPAEVRTMIYGYVAAAKESNITVKHLDKKTSRITLTARHNPVLRFAAISPFLENEIVPIVYTHSLFTVKTSDASDYGYGKPHRKHIGQPRFELDVKRIQHWSLQYSANPVSHETGVAPLAQFLENIDHARGVHSLHVDLSLTLGAMLWVYVAGTPRKTRLRLDMQTALDLLTVVWLNENKAREASITGYIATELGEYRRLSTWAEDLEIERKIKLIEEADEASDTAGKGA